MNVSLCPLYKFEAILGSKSGILAKSSSPLSNTVSIDFTNTSRFLGEKIKQSSPCGFKSS
jgi:hypothetical protein